MPYAQDLCAKKGERMNRIHMYKADREIHDDEKMNAIFKKCKYTTIALSHHNQPYIVTLSYGYDESKNTMYVH